jgi:hypothetical protein
MRWTAVSRCRRCAPANRHGAANDYKRHGTTSLFAALDIATGRVIGKCYPRHRADQLFLAQPSRTLLRAADRMPTPTWHSPQRRRSEGRYRRVQRSSQSLISMQRTFGSGH